MVTHFYLINHKKVISKVIKKINIIFNEIKKNQEKNQDFTLNRKVDGDDGMSCGPKLFLLKTIGVIFLVSLEKIGFG